MTDFFKVEIERYYKQEAWHDVSGFELHLVPTDKEYQSWNSREREHEAGVEMMHMLADSLVESGLAEEIEKIDRDTVRAVRWSSIGD